jgi:cytochrome c oxidase accessory protein FixG
VGYFTPIRDLVMEFFLERMSSWEVFWVFFYGFATYGNAGFMREQVCKYMCPYARFQSAMFDHDTLIVTYDAERGEPRGARSKKADASALNWGACIDCTLCVQVCPTGIDIRKGLQYECIGCGACIDVCDNVMDKVGYARGLVRYATQNALSHHWSAKQMWRRVMRPRVVVYTTVLVALTLGLFISLSLRTPLIVDVVRDRASLARITEVGTLENVYRLQLMNATEQSQTYRLRVSGLERLEIKTATEIEVAPAQARWVIVRADIPYGSAPQGSHKITFDIQAANGQDHVSEKSVFMVPR